MNYAYWLATVPGISNRVKLNLWRAVGSAAALYALTEDQLKKIDGVSSEVAAKLTASHRVDVDAAYAGLCAQGITFLSVEDDAYPKRLKEIADAPFGLYQKGHLPQGMRMIAIVGARRCSEYGRMIAMTLGRRLAEQGVCVISGMAQGIDHAGHEGALSTGGTTCAVLGCGVDICYPPSGRGIFEKIPNRGCILSEYPPKTEPKPYFFPQRNRIIAGLCEMVVVVEAKARSGSLITADCALEQGKDVYAVPGRITDPLSDGCNHLIRQGAGIILSVDDFLKELDLCGFVGYQQEKMENLLLEKEERLVYSCVDLRPKGIGELLEKTDLAPSQLAQILARLTQKGYVAETFKNHYIRQI